MLASAVEYDDIELVKSAAAGDAAAFEVLMRRHKGSVFRIAYRMLGNREDAEDVQQETFVRAYRHLRAFRGDAAFASWLHAIASRLCLSHRRSKTPALIITSEELANMPADLSTDPYQCLQHTAAAERVQRVLMLMAPGDRLLMILKYVEGFDHEEIATILHCSSQCSRSRLMRAKRIFKQKFDNME